MWNRSTVLLFSSKGGRGAQWIQPVETNAFEFRNGELALRKDLEDMSWMPGPPGAGDHPLTNQGSFLLAMHPHVSKWQLYTVLTQNGWIQLSTAHTFSQFVVRKLRFRHAYDSKNPSWWA